MYVVEKKATKGSKCKISRPECFKMTNFDRFHREAMGVRGLDNVSNIIFLSLLDSDWLKSVPINP